MLTHTLSVIIPCYNEEATLAHCLDSVLAIAGGELSLDIVIVDDASRDRSVEIATQYAQKHAMIRVLRHAVNGGKGAALKTGFAQARGDYVVVQDADLEYNPQDLRRMVVFLQNDEADVVFGSRFLGEAARLMPYGRHRIGNQLLTWLSNRFTGLGISDMETCYKMFRRELIQSITIEEMRFGVEPEMVAKIAAARIGGRRPRVQEIAVSYHGRTYAEGKKIGLKDALRAVYCIVKYSPVAALCRR